MILDIDVGNSYVKWRLTDGAEVCQSGSQTTKSMGDGGLELPVGVSISQVRLSSVAKDSLQSDLVAQMKAQFKAEVTVARVSSNAAGVVCGYDDPFSLGIDRWLAMVASYSRYQAAVLVVDAGSAMTLDLVSAEGRHIGGYILPGLTLMRNALWGGTDRVKVSADLPGGGIDPALDTAAAVNQGSLLASIAIIEKLLIRYQSNLVVTGGDAKKLLPYLKEKVDYQPNLVLDGLALGVVSTIKL
ncbi:MAG: type III pantothenate kinase [Porticoccaceae bacterium]|jgi:type III pantothenate kinase|nr:type III pantothenate kinase [Porticoccaceae bacterium]MBT3797811.1 type III pantothenate kinase [Porticoccaceae bacterium]MBT4164203.1 type III pantothenate kinase [Porticoccaceae bacterium]MBT4211040.1 type III pantothenate kinase [Porticoccaceae bacterium]MBT4591953.1 type III pantothenate kinase [Porticoccaceae bacterium]|tara:strand:+ start:1807 stop:2535 length:729 start_codon:yes stop_codon:yes gene_type:complete